MKATVEFKEPKKMNIKKIIAREGLVFGGFLVIPFTIAGILSLFISWKISSYLALYILLLGYPTYLLIRFINWVIMTLADTSDNKRTILADTSDNKRTIRMTVREVLIFLAFVIPAFLFWRSQFSQAIRFLSWKSLGGEEIFLAILFSLPPYFLFLAVRAIILAIRRQKK